MADWIKIHRSVLDSYSFADPITFKIWVWMLLKANYKASFVPLNHGKGTVSIKVDRGQFIFGRNRASEELKIAGSTIVRHMEKLQTEGQIIIEPNNQYSLITICKYNTYQNIKEKDGQVTDSERTSNGQVTDSERTSNGHIQEELADKEGKEELEFNADGKNFDFEEILNPDSFPTWRTECSTFLKDEYFKQGFCKDQNLPMGNTEELMKEFIKKLNLENDFKNVAGLKVHFVRHYKKHLNGRTYSAFTQSKGFIEVPNPSDYDKMQTW